MKHLDLVILAAERIIERNLPVRMSRYRSGVTIEEDPLTNFSVYISKTPCGTAGCFAGWLPYVGIPELEITKEYATWEGYLLDKLEVTPSEFMWLFGVKWPDSPHFNLVRAKLLRAVGEDRVEYLLGLNRNQLLAVSECHIHPDLIAKVTQEITP